MQRYIGMGEIPGEELVKELIRRNKLGEAPSQRTFACSHHEAVIGVGKDYSGYLTFDDDALDALFGDESWRERHMYSTPKKVKAKAEAKK